MRERDRTNMPPLPDPKPTCRYGVRVRSTLRVSLIAFALVGAIPAPPAWAAPICLFDQMIGRVDVAVAEGDVATIGRAGDAIALDSTPCDTATVSNTETIAVTGTGTPVEVRIDLSGGVLAPGLTTETDGGTSEIEISITLPTGSPTLRITGTAVTDTVVVGSAGINLNADEATPDVDLTISGSPIIFVEGGDGADTLSVAGGTAEGSAVPSAILAGDAGDDLLLAGSGPNTLDGGEGTDTADYAAATQLLLADLGAVRALHADGSIDVLAAIENLTGSPGDDTIIGDAGDNVLRGGAGNDVLDGADGNDELTGGDGVDTAAFREASTGVAVDLQAGTAAGAGDDVLAEIENVTGSDLADTILGDGGGNVLRGLYGGDEVRGRAGNDVVRGGKGGDLLFGGAGDDLLHAGHGRDQLDGGEGEDVCRGAPGPDSFVFCENYPTRE